MVDFNSWAKKVTDTVGELANNVTDSSKKFAEKNKIKSQISKDQRAITEIYKKLGEITYESKGVLNPEDCQEYFNQIDGYKTEIDNLNTQLISLDGAVICNNCGANIPSNAKFCPNCGAENSKYTEPTNQSSNKGDVAEVEVFCKKCGTKITNKIKFCPKCGTLNDLYIENAPIENSTAEESPDPDVYVDPVVVDTDTTDKKE